MKMSILGDTPNSRTGTVEEWISELEDWASASLGCSSEKGCCILREKNWELETTSYVLVSVYKWFQKVKEIEREGAFV